MDTVAPLAPLAPFAPASAVSASAAPSAAQLLALQADSPSPEPTVSTPPAGPAFLAAAPGLQSGLAPLMADLAAALPSLPAAVQAAATQVLGLPLPLHPPPTAEALRDAVISSGLFLETQLATGDAPAGSDLKSALSILELALESWGGAAVASEAGPVRPGLPPPYPGGALRPQGAAIADLPLDAPLEQVAARLSRLTTGALARQALMQAGSATRPPVGGRAGSAHWLFELLFATPDGVVVAPFEIDREPQHGEDDEDQSLWRAAFSLDVAGAGPVHAKVSLAAGKIRVALWAEDQETRAQLHAQLTDLSEALRAEAGEDFVGAPEIVVHGGAPDAAPIAAGRFVDASA